MAHTRVFQVSGGGGPLVEARRPVAAPGPGDVLVRVRAVSLNARDLPIVEGRYARPVPRGRVPLSDGAGVVEAVGAGVTRWQVGDRVVGVFHPGWLYGALPGWDTLYGVQLDGWLAEQVVVGEHDLVAVPEHLSFEEAATLPCAALTAWSALAGTGPGDTVLLQGSGGVSLFACQFARLAGARVLITTSSPHKADQLLALGAEVVDTPAQARDLTGGVDLVVEMGGGGRSIAQSIAALAMGGRIALVGNLAAGGGMDLTAFLARAATLRTTTVGNRADFERMNRAISAHRLRPVIDRVFPFDQANDAVAHFRARTGVGKVVVSVPHRGEQRPAGFSGAAART
ncbi:alcohol dehydrogenase [Actinokineospora bangkokensis]|uniref:Alcohol dehydrogenase n=1 Tax=Actinokineospora bangkokensis TaxID=1193682 RepID=A0A1Q9LMY6_9PSEU|nr:alcohol dehydrogenase [Actinokineospora bangkokensis]